MLLRDDEEERLTRIEEKVARLKEQSASMSRDLHVATAEAQRARLALQVAQRELRESRERVARRQSSKKPL